MVSEDTPDFEVELAKMLVTANLSLIFFGRRAFPENCFRKISVHDLDNPRSTHECLMESGRPLSSRESHDSILRADSETLVYVKPCKSSRLDGLLADLNQIYSALEDQLVGKVYICFTSSKKWSKDSLLECYTLKFSYTELGGFLIYVDWVGLKDIPLKASADTFRSLKQLVDSCPELPDVFYTHLFVSSVDTNAKLEGVWAGKGHGVREAVWHLKGRQGSGGGRIGRFMHMSPLEEAAESAQQAKALSLSGCISPHLENRELSKSIPPNRFESISAALPGRPESRTGTSEQRKESQRTRASRSRPRGSAESPSQAKPGFYPDDSQAYTDWSVSEGQAQSAVSRGSTLVNQPARKSLRKRSSRRGTFAPFVQKREQKAKMAPKYDNRLAVIEEISEDLPPTQRLESQRQGRQSQKSTNGNSTDTEKSPSPTAKRIKVAPEPEFTWEQLHAALQLMPASH